MKALEKELADVLFRIIIKTHPMPWRHGQEFGNFVVRDYYGIEVAVFEHSKDAEELVNLATVSASKMSAKDSQ